VTVLPSPGADVPNTSYGWKADLTFRKDQGMPDALALAAYGLCEEVRDGAWDVALKRVLNGQPAASPEVIDELRNRCPGYSTQEYQRAIAQGMFNSR
jgi:hypothetical protein